MLFPIVIPASAVIAVLPIYAQEDNSLSMLLLVLIVCLHPIVQAATIFYIASVINGESLARNDCYRLAASRWVPLFGLYILGTTLMVAGFILFIVPGLIVFARIMFSEFYCLLNKQGSLESFSTSWEETKDYQWVLLAGAIIILVLTSFPLNLIGNALNTAESIKPAVNFVLNIFNYILGSLITIFAYRVFTLHLEQKGKTIESDLPED